MAQQTINVGTAPNDGTGTPLRTAFQYTNSNFSELYTAVGPSGNNIVVPGNATISGDLTVRTTGLVVNSTGASISNSTPLSGIDSGLLVGTVGTSKCVAISMLNCLARLRERDAFNNFAITTNIGATGTIDDNTSSSWKIRIGSGNENYVLQRAGIGSSTFQDLLTIDSGGVCVWSDGAGGTRMTLNSTGLGVGVSPSYKLDVLGSATISGRFKTSGALNALYLEDSGTTAGSLYIGTSGNEFRIVTGSNIALAIDVNRNFAIGPTSVTTTATDGFVYVPVCAGAPTGTPTAKGGRAAFVVDSTNNRFYVYVGGAWKYAALV